MASSRRRKPRRKRIGQVSYYLHHGGWWVYYKDGERQVRRRAGDDEALAEQVAAQVNAQLATAAPTMFSFTPLTVPELCQQFLDHHEHVLRSSLATIRRYRAGLSIWRTSPPARGNPPAHEIQADRFVRFLRSTEVAPNGHAHAKRRAPGQGRPVHPGDLPLPVRLRGQEAAPAALRREPVRGPGRQAVPDRGRQADLRLRRRHGAGVPQGRRRLGLSDPLHPGQDRPSPRRTDPPADRGSRPRRGWMHVRNKPELGWRIKTRRERSVPLVDELVAVLRR